MIDQFKALVHPQTYKRGEHYYHDNRVIAYRLTQLKNKRYQIKATIVGTREYPVEIEFNFKGDTLQYRGYCGCPYIWDEICKHQVAAMLHFFYNDLAKLKFPKCSLNPDFDRLLAITENPDKVPLVLSYQVKGLLLPRMVNFSVALISPEVEEKEMQNLIDYIQSSEPDCSLAYYGFEIPLDQSSLQVVEYLKNTATRSSRAAGTVLIPKTPGNFAFIYNLTKSEKVTCQETGQKILPGKSIQPVLSISGTEDKVEFQIVHEDFQVYSNQNQEDKIWWTMIDDWLHPIDMHHLESLPSKVQIPEEKKGQFLFEILPEFQRRFNAKLSEQLQDYEVIKTYPEIALHFDYQAGEIICTATIKINDREVTGVHTLDLPLEEANYERLPDKPKTWSGVDRTSLNGYIRFLEENEFIISKGQFVIKDEMHIQDFLTGGFPHISEDWIITQTDSFAELEVIPIELEPIVEISTDGSIDWFDFRVTYTLGGQTFTHQEILALLRKNRQGESFIKLGNRFFVIYNDEKSKLIEETAKLAHQEHDKFRTQFFNLLYYQNIFQEKGILVNGDRIYNELKEDITEQKVIQQWEIPPIVEGVLRNYQRTGYQWMRFLYKYHFGGILADDMGLGKTIQVLTLIKAINSNLPALVVCPKTLLHNWADEIEKFFPDMKYLIYYGTPTERQSLSDQLDQYSVVITTYAIIGRDLDFLQEKKFAFCILDEAQQIKNYRTKRAESVKNIRADHRLILTGTPIENSVEELWSLFDFLMGGYLGTHTGFVKEYLHPIKENNDKKVLGDLKKRVAPFILRRTKSEVLTELPEKMEQIKKVDMTQLQADTYQTILNEVRAEVISSVQQFGFKRSQITVLAALTKLRQVCNHPELVLKDLEEKVTSGKVDALLETVQEAISAGHKMLIFSQFVKMLRIIEEEFKRVGITYEYLDGSTKNRMERVKHFNDDPSISTFLISLKAGGTGLNLTSADIVIHVDPWWNPQVENQASDRVHRIGQTNKVMIYKLITAGTVEEKMLKLQERKRHIFDAIIEENAEVVEQLTWEDVQELFSM